MDVKLIFHQIVSAKKNGKAISLSGTVGKLKGDVFLSIRSC